MAGVFEIVLAIKLHKQIANQWMLALEGVLSSVFGILLFLSPLAGAIVIGLWLGAYARVLRARRRRPILTRSSSGCAR